MDNNWSDPDSPQQDSPARQRLERLSRFSAGQNPAQTAPHATYTNFIRRMRLILPLIAVCIIVALMAWPDSQKTIQLLEAHEKESLQTIRKNELTNPKFESVDEKNQPYSVTAEKAVQTDDDSNTLLLEKPAAELHLDDGGWVALKAATGKYGQESQKLDLRQNVIMTHSDGYQMDTASLFIDLKAETAQTDTAVSGFGPAGTLVASGLQSDNKEGTLIFTGPAKLVLKDSGALQGLSSNDTRNKQDHAPGATDITEQPDEQ